MVIKLEHPVGTYVGKITLEVNTPASLVCRSNTDVADATWGYSSYIEYKICNQFGDQLVPSVGVNEHWETGVVKDCANDWRRGPAAGWFTGGANHSFQDHIGGEEAGRQPAPQAPQNPLGATKIYHWGQAWYVGSADPGQGVWVQLDTLQKYRDHARHE